MYDCHALPLEGEGRVPGLLLARSCPQLQKVTENGAEVLDSFWCLVQLARQRKQVCYTALHAFSDTVSSGDEHLLELTRGGN